MRKLFILFIGLLAISCQQAKSQSSGKKLTANVKAFNDGTSVYISEYGDGNKIVAADTLQIKNGKFVFDFPERDHQTLSSIQIEGSSGYIYFINENEPLEITILKDENNFLLNDPKIKGGEANTVFVDYMSFMNGIDEKMAKIMEEYSTKDMQDPEVQNVLREIEDRNLQEITDYLRTTVEDHPNALSSAYILADLFSLRTVSPTKLEEIYNNFSEEVKESPIGKELRNVIAPVQEPKIGETVPEFSARNPEGEVISLKDILAQEGEYTLIEFWASWCPNCQEEMPHLVEVYNEFKDQGLKIIGVSIDKEKSEWENMIRDYKMEWTQVSNLNHWQDPIIQKYGVNSIPTNFLVDKEGKVIAVKLDHIALKSKLEELLK